MRRREVIAFVGGAVVWPLHINAQPAGKRPFVAVLVGGSESSSERYRASFADGLHQLGYENGRNVRVEYSYADGDVRRLPTIAQDVLRQRPDVIVSGTSYGTVVARQATPSVPIVSAVLVDPVGSGLVASYAQPGGNVTGILNTVETLPGKLLELAHEVTSGEGMTGIVVNVSNPSNVLYGDAVKAAAGALGTKIATIEVRSSDDLEGAFARLVAERVRIALFLQDAMFLRERRRIVDLALASGVPTLFGFREHVEEGGLLSYGVDLRQSWRRAANYVDKILRGATPADLPVEFPTKLELAVNLKTAARLGIRLPPSLIARADEVIE